MVSVSALEILKGWGKQEINSLVSLLNEYGMISDEEHTGLSSTMVERWSDECEVFLRNNGYVGGEISSSGKYFNESGAIYALYDTDKHDIESAHEHLVSIKTKAQS